MPKKKIENEDDKLKPVIEKNDRFDNEHLEALKQAFINEGSDDKIGLIDDSSKQLDSFFNNVLNQLYDDTDIEMKTEYADETVVFSMAALDTLGKTCNIPIINSFLKKYDKRMVSHKRQGRTEIISGLQRRQEAEQSMISNATGVKL